MSTFKRIQGNSLWINVTCETYADVDPVWPNYSSEYNITDMDGAVINSGAITRSETEGVFYLRVPPAVMASLAVGTYTLTVQVVNSNVDYEEEQQHKLIITQKELIT